MGRALYLLQRLKARFPAAKCHYLFRRREVRLPNAATGQISHSSSIYSNYNSVLAFTEHGEHSASSGLPAKRPGSRQLVEYGVRIQASTAPCRPSC